jgi:hypothetical protein
MVLTPDDEKKLSDLIKGFGADWELRAETKEIARKSKELASLVGNGQSKVLSSYYVFSYLVPIILIKRIIGGQKYSSDTCEFPPTPKLINGFLVKLNQLEIYFSKFIKIPFGSSLFCMIEKL